ncbi:MAG: hypothetical protein IPH88_16060 [Bacteroidales bacterium]|nr:hypothetical protein [Bacteroidales bacterium]
MDSIEIKLKVIEACRKKLLESISNLESVIADAQQQANDYGPPRDRYDAFRSQLLRRKDMMAQQLDKEMVELKTLEKIELSKPTGIAGFGSLVLTNNQNYFISIGIGKMECENLEFYAISPLVPLSQAVNGKKSGDTVDFRGNKFLIREVI